MAVSELQALAARLTAGAASPAERAVRLHDFVRDRRFGWTAFFDAAPPLRTVKSDRGHCNPKATLFVELLRAAGFEARIWAVNIRADLLEGCFPGGVGPAAVTHTVAEVRVPPQQRWVRVDSYTLDRPLHEAAVARLRREGRQLGWGAHVGGTVDWDGASDAFAQLVDPQAMIQQELGTFDSMAEVMRHPQYLHRGLLGLPYSSLLRPAAALLPDGAVQRAFNARVDALRREGGQVAVGGA